MNTSLFISFAIIVAGLLGALYYNRIDATLDNMLKGLGKLARDILKFTLYGLFLLLFLGAIYAVFEWATTGNAPTFQQQADAFTSEAERAADYVGNLVNGDSNSVPGAATSAINSPSKVLTANAPFPADAIVYNMGPTSSAGNAALAAYESHRGIDFASSFNSPCNRLINPSGNCFGLSRFFQNENFINTCNKIYVTAPQMIRRNDLVNFPL